MNRKKRTSLSPLHLQVDLLKLLSTKVTRAIIDLCYELWIGLHIKRAANPMPIDIIAKQWWHMELQHHLYLKRGHWSIASKCSYVQTTVGTKLLSTLCSRRVLEELSQPPWDIFALQEGAWSCRGSKPLPLAGLSSNQCFSEYCSSIYMLYPEFVFTCSSSSWEVVLTCKQPWRFLEFSVDDNYCVSDSAVQIINFGASKGN